MDVGQSHSVLPAIGVQRIAAIQGRVCTVSRHRRAIGMSRISLGLLSVVAVVGVSTAMAQQRVARVPSGMSQADTTFVSPGQAALDRAAAANKYLFLFFYKEKNPATDAAWTAFQPAVGRMADSADFATIAITDPAEKALVARYDLSRSPMPLVLAIAPNGAITKAFPGKFDPRQIESAFVSPCTQQCLKALQDRKLVLLCVQEPPQQTPGQPAEVTVPKGVADFKADPRYGQATEVVLLNP